MIKLRNLQEQVKKAFCYQKLFWPFTVWINCSSDLKNYANSWPSASNFKSFSRSLEQFFLTVGQNNFGNKIPNLFIILIESFYSVWILLCCRKKKLHTSGNQQQGNESARIVACSFYILHFFRDVLSKGNNSSINSFGWSEW